MINRVLIRIKVVQLLYSYLLTRGELKLPKEPEAGSRDKAFAYLMYHDILSFLVSLGNRDSVSRSDLSALSTNSFLKFLSNDEVFQASLKANSHEMSLLLTVRKNIISAISDEAFYKSFVHKRNRGLSEEVQLIREIVNVVLANNVEFEQAARGMEGYTGAGFRKAFNMVNDTLDAFLSSRSGLTEARNSLARSLDKAYELYNSLLYLIVELTRMQEQRIDAAKHKHLATVDDLNPNMRFVENRLAKMLENDETLNAYVSDNSISWIVNNVELVRRLLDRITESETYAEYMSMPEVGLKEDCEFWKNALKKIVFPDDDLSEVLEGMSVYWNDDLDIMDSFVLKTIKKASTDGFVTILPKYKDDEDAAFGAELFDLAVKHRDEYKALIDRFVNTKQWDSERLAFMDIVIMLTAISEIMNYPAIPIAVSLNEYIEIANSYSSPRSGSFVHGILTSVIGFLQEEGQLSKH